MREYIVNASDFFFFLSTMTNDVNTFFFYRTMKCAVRYFNRSLALAIINMHNVNTHRTIRREWS